MRRYVSRYANTHTHTLVLRGYVGDEPFGAAAGPRVHPAHPSRGQRPPSKSNNSKTRLWETAMCVCLCVKESRRDRATWTEGGDKKGVCVGTFVYLCCLCVCVMGKLVSERLVFSPRHLRMMLLLEIMRCSHKQNLILLIIRQHDNNNSYLWNKPITGGWVGVGEFFGDTDAKQLAGRSNKSDSSLILSVYAW